MSKQSDKRREYLLRKYFASASPLKAQRLAAGLSLAELADLAGCSHQTLARAERGERIGSGIALRIAEGLRVPVHFVFPDSSDADSIRAACGGYLELAHD